MARFEVVVTAHNSSDRLFWTNQIAEKVVEFVGGVSVYEGKGGWRSPETGAVIYEQHTLLVAHVASTQALFAHLKPTLKQYRESAEQEVVFVVVDGEPYSLNQAVFDAMEESVVVVTDPRFWDCECEGYHIHAKVVDVVCPLCGARADEQPDARVDEIGKGGLFATDNSWLVAYNLSEYYDSLDEFDLRRYKV